MTKKKFKLSANDNRPCEIEIKNPETETHALLRLSDGAFCDFLNLAFTSAGKDTVEKIEAKTFLQLDLEHYKSFSLNGNFTDEKGFVEGELYTGNWEEIVLREIELSFSDAPFFYSCDLENLKFSVGVSGESYLEVESDAEGNFSVVSTIKHLSGKMDVAKRNFAETSDGAEIIKRLYGRLKGRAKGEGFDERQESQKGILTEQFNKTMCESFRVAK